MSAMSNISVRRYLVYLIATVVTVGIFFSHDSLKTSHLIHSHSSSRLFHVDQNFLSHDKQGRGGGFSASHTKVQIHGEFSLSELQQEIKKIKDTHKKGRKDTSKDKDKDKDKGKRSSSDANGSSSASRRGGAAPAQRPGRRHEPAPFTFGSGGAQNSNTKAPPRPKRSSRPRNASSTSPSSSSSNASRTNMKRIAADLEKHRANNPTFAKKDPFEEKCVTNTLADRLERPFKDNYIAARENHAYRSNFKVPKYWPLHMRGNNICKHIKWQVVGQVNNKVSRLLPVTDYIKEKLKGGRDKFTSCAVVGNGGGSLLKDYGKYIDDHELVLRFNGGPTAGFERHVGSKTTFRITNSEHFFFHEKPTNETVLQHITNSKNFKQLFKVADRDALKDRLPNLQIIDPFFQYYVLNLHNDGAPSNGFYGIAFANLVCNRITLFGYQKEWKHQKIPYHYYDKVEPNSNQYGRDLREVQRFEELLSSINLVAERDPLWVEWMEKDKWTFGKKIAMADDVLYYLDHRELFADDYESSHTAEEEEEEEEEGVREGGEDNLEEGEEDGNSVEQPAERKGFFSKLFGGSSTKSPPPQPKTTTTTTTTSNHETISPSPSEETDEPQAEPEVVETEVVETEVEKEAKERKETIPKEEDLVVSGDADADVDAHADAAQNTNDDQGQQEQEDQAQAQEGVEEEDEVVIAVDDLPSSEAETETETEKEAEKEAEKETEKEAEKEEANALAIDEGQQQQQQKSQQEVSA